MTQFDVTILTDQRYVAPKNPDPYLQNILLEDQLLIDGLIELGVEANKKSWDDPTFDWSSTRSVVFRSTWDYFHRYNEFNAWIESIKNKTRMFNSYELIKWNLDKHYLQNLETSGIKIPDTIFIEIGDQRSLEEIAKGTSWETFILKPAIAGAARHTYKFSLQEASNFEDIFSELIASESMLLQEFQKNIITKGEISLNMVGEEFTHAVLKKAKAGDFRVQDDFGGTLHDYQPSNEEIAFAKKVVQSCEELPVYSRVDIIWNNQDEPCISELELIEPELWFRREPEAAKKLAQLIILQLNN